MKSERDTDKISIEGGRFPAAIRARMCHRCENKLIFLTTIRPLPTPVYTLTNPPAGVYLT